MHKLVKFKKGVVAVNTWEHTGVKQIAEAVSSARSHGILTLFAAAPV